MLCCQCYANIIDINHPVCGEKRESEMLDCAADVSFYRSAEEGREMLWML